MSEFVRTATLIKGTEAPVGEGTTGPMRALVRVAGEPAFAVILKKIPIEAVVAECFGALLLQAWRVPVPEPLIISDDDQILFGSKDAEYPNLKQRIGFSDDLPQAIKDELIKIGATIVSKLPETPIALVADEAIDNRDRNLGNVLWDGENVAFVDHERAFGLAPDADMNKLAMLAEIAGEAEKMERAAVTLALTVSEELVRQVAQNSRLDSHGYADYVALRIKTLASRVLSRFPKPVDLFTGLE